MRWVMLVAVMAVGCGGSEGGGEGPDLECVDVETLTGPRSLCEIEPGYFPEAPDGCFLFTIDPAASEDTAIFCPPSNWEGDWFWWRTDTECESKPGDPRYRQEWQMAVRRTEAGSHPGETLKTCGPASDCMRGAVLGTAACCPETQPRSKPLYWNCDGSPY